MGSQGAALSQIRAVYEDGAVAGMTDAQLVERFAGGGGKRAVAAFSALVWLDGWVSTGGRSVTFTVQVKVFEIDPGRKSVVSGDTGTFFSTSENP